jgi:hypothetical protein
MMAGRLFARFHLDVAVGDPVLEPLNMTKGRDWLGFAGISAGRFPTITVEQQFAEKLHAYTLPRTKPNSRVRDFVDMALLVKGDLDHALVKKALRAVFERRKTHPIPATLESPPSSWEAPYADVAAGCKLSTDIEKTFLAIRDFWKRLGFNPSGA